jgi:hypothetical protein
MSEKRDNLGEMPVGFRIYWKLIFCSVRIVGKNTWSEEEWT